MASLLTPGQSVQLDGTGVSCTVGRFLGQGGQGAVFEAHVAPSSSDPQTYALKWYTRKSASAQQRLALAEMIRSGSPHDRFLWPIAIATADGVPGFGYLMPLREPRFHGIRDLVDGYLPWSARVVASIGIEIADSFLRLHTKGLCYRDINFGNVFVDPIAGDVRICDNDNVGVDGRSPAAVSGTPGFMAPEIVREEAEPSTRTDLYSLAVLLFYLCVRDHPLMGAREATYENLDTQARVSLLGKDPLFIFDPNDASNRPVPGIHNNALFFWPMYPGFVQERFVRAFTSGLDNPATGRVAESIWKATMARLRDVVVDCPSCGNGNFADPYAPGGEPRPCWSCQRPVEARFVLWIGDAAVVLNSSTVLYPHHLRRVPYDYGTRLAAVAHHPADPTIWGLRNDTDVHWKAVDADGNEHDVPSGRTVRVADGVQLDFGSVTGVIRAATSGGAQG